jgi:hypothetical protein
MAAEFDRIVKVTAYLQPTDFVGNNPQFFERTQTAFEVLYNKGQGNRIQFEVEKNLGSQPNKCKIRLTNLSEFSRDEFERLPVQVVLTAGHAGIARLLFIGDLREFWSERDGASIVTTLVLKDGMRAYQHARMNKSYKAGVTVLRVVQDAAQSMGLAVPPELAQTTELRQVLPTGVSMSGVTRDLLTELLAPYGYHWSIQNSRLTIIKDDTFASGEILIVDQENGLIDSPKITTPEQRAPAKPGARHRSSTKPKKYHGPEVKFQSILNPDLNPGRRVGLQSEFLNIGAKILDVKHVGDTHGKEFNTDVSAKPI